MGRQLAAQIRIDLVILTPRWFFYDFCLIAPILPSFFLPLYTYLIIHIASPLQEQRNATTQSSHQLNFLYTINIYSAIWIWQPAIFLTMACELLFLKSAPKAKGWQAILLSPPSSTMKLCKFGYCPKFCFPCDISNTIIHPRTRDKN